MSNFSSFLMSNRVCQMASLFSGTTLYKNKGGAVDASVLEGKTLGVFYGAIWSPHSRAFTKDLKNFYNELKGKGARFEIIFASLDENESDMQRFLAEDQDSWYYLKFGDPLIQKLNDMHHPGHVDRLPVLIIISPNGKQITDLGVIDVMSEKTPLQVLEGWNSAR